jgi:tetratricopeptide (TPR) repeat protein
VRKSLLATIVLGGVLPFGVGCMSKTNAPTLANNNASTDWFGAKKLAALFKPDPPAPNSRPADPSDPTSLAFKGKPIGADFYVSAARLYEKRDNFAAAEDQYQRALKATPGDLAALIGYAHLLDRQGKFDDATRYYLQAVQQHPQDATAHNDLGLCYARRGMMNESLVALSKAVELQPDRKLYRNNIATVFVEVGQPQKALEHLMIGEQPAVAHYNLACLLHQRGHSQAAAHHFAQAAQHDPSLAAAQEWAQKLGAAPAGPRMTGVRAVESSAAYQPNTQWSQSDVSQPPQARIAQHPATSAAARGWPGSGADRSWSAYDVSSPAGGPASVSISDSGRGALSASVPPTPETADNYSLPTSAALPPVEQTVPRY